MVEKDSIKRDIDVSVYGWSAGGSERNKRHRRNKKRKGSEKEERRANVEASWVLVVDIDEKKKAERETQTKKE